MKRSSLQLMLLLLLFTAFTLPVMAKDILSYQQFKLHPFWSFSKASLYAPRFQEQENNKDRIYIKTDFKRPVFYSLAVIDGKTPVKPFGDALITSFPAELIHNEEDPQVNVVSFPKEAFLTAKNSIVFEFSDARGKQKRFKLKKDELTEFLTVLGKEISEEPDNNSLNQTDEK